jgi:hypothetical protein
VHGRNYKISGFIDSFISDGSKGYIKTLTLKILTLKTKYYITALQKNFIVCIAPSTILVPRFKHY